MAQQVKFYSTSAADYAAQVSANTVNGGGVYFVDGGELYKGTQRFGLGRVTVAESTAGIEGAARGDIVVTGSGAGWVFDGTSWQSIGGDVGSLTSAWRADISASLAGLSVGTSTSYITNITQNADGSVTANAVAFPALDTGDNDGEVKLGSDAAKVSGWDALKGRVSAIESIVDASTSTVTAATGNFTNLNVSDTATFSATTVSATTLTIGGSTVNQIAQDEISAVTANTITATGTSLPTESAVATYVSAAVSNLAGAMHFRGTATITKSGNAITVTNFQETFTPAGGDVVVDTTNNLEAVYTGSAWELLGSNSVYALDAYAPGTESVTAATTTLGGAVHAIAAQVDTLTTSFGNLGTAASKNYADSLTATGTSLPTESAVAGYVTGVIEGLAASVSSSENASIKVGVTQVDGVVTGVTADLVWLGADGTALS